MSNDLAAWRFLTIGAVALTLALALPANADTHTPDPGMNPDSSVGPSSPYTNYGSGNVVYDLAPAYSMAARSSEVYDIAYSDLQTAISHLRQQYMASDEYVAAKKKVADTEAAYNAAREPVVQEVSNDPKYHDLVEMKTKIEIALKQKNLPMEDRIALATKKMEYSAAKTRMEADALNSSASVQQARSAYEDAVADMNSKMAKFEAGLPTNSQYLAAKQALDLARVNKAAAMGYLSGAWMSRGDTVDADYRRYEGNNPGVYNYSGGYYDPYYAGYYGVGTIRRF